MTHIAVLLLEGAFDTGVSSVLDTLDTANALDAPRKNAEPRLRLSRVGVRRQVTTSQGFSIPLALARSIPRPDIVIVPAIGAKTKETLEVALRRDDITDACKLLRAWKKTGTRVAGVCTGTFILAQAGLLDGRRATTTWWLAPTLRERFPEVVVDESRMVVESRGVITAGAALAHLDLAFYLLRRVSPKLARVTASYMLFDGRPSQAAYILPDHASHSDPVVEKFEDFARKNLSSFTLHDAARSAGVSERTLERRLRHVMGKSPVSYLQDLRVERAMHDLSTTEASLDDVAERVGYKDGVTLRALLKKKTGRGIRELRARGTGLASDL